MIQYCERCGKFMSPVSTSSPICYDCMMSDLELSISAGSIELGCDESNGIDYGCKMYGYVRDGKITVTSIEYLPIDDAKQ